MPDLNNIIDPREMRKALNRIARTGTMEGDRTGLSASAMIVRNVAVMASVRGLSGEDHYTMLAWHLLEHARRMEQILLDEARNRLPAPIIISKEQADGLWPLGKPGG